MAHNRIWLERKLPGQENTYCNGQLPSFCCLRHIVTFCVSKGMIQNLSLIKCESFMIFFSFSLYCNSGM